MLRFEKVEGSTGKFNDVVLNYSVKMGDAKKVVVFFGGDIQDFPEAMMKHRDNRLYVQWNLENMATLMGKHFPNAHCIIIRPNRLQYLTFSCYDNFVESNDMGGTDSRIQHFCIGAHARSSQHVVYEAERQNG
ncbi:hypothetical protein MRX96_027007 [Rhipicephalus microplus]